MTASQGRDVHGDIDQQLCEEPEGGNRRARGDRGKVITPSDVECRRGLERQFRSKLLAARAGREAGIDAGRTSSKITVRPVVGDCERQLPGMNGASHRAVIPSMWLFPRRRSRFRLECCRLHILDIMNDRSRNRMTAWLGVFAMWLIIFAPIVSQGLISHEQDSPFASICSAESQPDAGDRALAVHLDSCGYCDLLAHHVPSPSPAMPQVQAIAHYRVAQPFAAPTFVWRDVSPTARPRDSPFLV